MYDVITVGSATIDVFAKAQSELIKLQTHHHTDKLIAFPSGAKILIDELDYAVGGGGTNTAVAFARLGKKTAFCGCIGNEDTQVQALLKKEHIDFVGHTVTEKTGYSIILDSLDADRTILTYKGANNYLDFKKIKPPKAKTFYFSSMIDKAFEAQRKLAQFAHEHHIRLAFNPSLYHVIQGLEKLRCVLEYTDILVFNKEEACTLCKCDDIEQILKMLHAMGVHIVIITDGPHTCHAYDGTYHFWFTPQKVTVVEATGAGDAFAATFVAWYEQTKHLEESLKAALHNAQSVLTHPGAKEKLLTHKELLPLVQHSTLLIHKARV